MLIVVLVAVFLVIKAVPSIIDDKAGFLTSTEWNISPNGEEEVVVKVHQVVRNPKGELLADRLVMHVFQMRNGLIQRFDIRDE